MSGNVVGFLEVMIQNLRAENQELKKKVEDMTEWGKVILADYQTMAEENEQLKEFINKVMQRVQEGAGDGKEVTVSAEETQASTQEASAE